MIHKNKKMKSEIWDVKYEIAKTFWPGNIHTAKPEVEFMTIAGGLLISDVSNEWGEGQ